MTAQDVDKHLIGRHEQKDHDPNKKGKKERSHRRDDHDKIKSLIDRVERQKDQSIKDGDVGEHTRSRHAAAALKDHYRGKTTRDELKQQTAQARAAGARMREAQESGRVTVGKHTDYQEVERIMDTRIEFLVGKAQEHANSEDELYDNILDIAEHIEKMLVDDTGLEDVTKQTVIVEQYTRQDGTVVPRHERQISARAAAALTGALGAAALASPLGRPLRQGVKAGFQSGGDMGSWRSLYNARNAPGTRLGLELGNAADTVGRAARQGPQNFASGLSRSNPGNMSRSYRAGSGARSRADSVMFRGMGARNAVQGAPAAARRFGANTQMQAGVAAQGARRGVSSARSGLQSQASNVRSGANAARINFGAGRSIGSQGDVGFRGAALTGQANPSLGAGIAAGATGRAVRQAGDRAAPFIQDYGVPVAGGGLAAGAAGVGAGALYGRNRERERTRKSLSDADIYVLEKYLGRNLDG